MQGIKIRSVAEARATMPAAFAAIDSSAKARDRRAAWLAQKLGKFGASSAAAFWTATLAIANNKTSRGYIERKAAELDGVMQPEIGGPSLRWGNDQEAPGMLEFIDRTGLTVLDHGDDQKWVAAEWSDQIGATPDGVMWHKQEFCIPVEQKNPYSTGEHGRLLTMRQGTDLMKVNHKYWCQVQHQIMVLDAPFGIFFTRDCRRTEPNARMGWWKIDRDDDFISKHKARLIEAITERNNLFEAQKGREWVDLSQIIKQ